MKMLYGQDAIQYKKENPDAELNKYTDPTEEERFDISVDFAEEVAAEDPNLIWIEAE